MTVTPGGVYLSHTGMIYTRAVATETLHEPDCLHVVTSDTSTTAGLLTSQGTAGK